MFSGGFFCWWWGGVWVISMEKFFMGKDNFHEGGAGFPSMI